VSAAAAFAELRRLADAAERIAEALERLADADRAGPGAEVARLVAAIHQAAGDEPMRCTKILELGANPLRPALAAALGDRSAKALGKLLGRYAGIGIDGLRIERAPGRRWRVCAFERGERRGGFNPWRL
jgi:hypothetical protein